MNAILQYVQYDQMSLLVHKNDKASSILQLL